MLTSISLASCANLSPVSHQTPEPEDEAIVYNDDTTFEMLHCLTENQLENYGLIEAIKSVFPTHEHYTGVEPINIKDVEGNTYNTFKPWSIFDSLSQFKETNPVEIVIFQYFEMQDSTAQETYDPAIQMANDQILQIKQYCEPLDNGKEVTSFESLYYPGTQRYYGYPLFKFNHDYCSYVARNGTTLINGAKMTIYVYAALVNQEYHDWNKYNDFSPCSYLLHELSYHYEQLEEQQNNNQQ